MKKTLTLTKYKTQDNSHLFPKDYEKVDPVSVTVPNETYSLREIVEKFSREYPKQLLRTGYSDDINDNDPDFDDVDITRSPDFDLTDAYNLKSNLKEKYKPKQIKEIKNPNNQIVEGDPNTI